MKQAINLAAGILVGLAVAGPITWAAETYFQAAPSTQVFFVNDRQVALEAYAISGSNYVRLRDVGQAVGFGVEYDAADNSVRISSAQAHDEPAPADDRYAAIPADGSRYIPKAGDVIRCNDGTDYTITDVSRWDTNAFADGPLGELPAPTCDWSLLDQPSLPETEARHFTVGGKEYLFLRNLYETRRMLCTLYNAIGNNPSTWQDGRPVLRKDGSQFVRIDLSVPSGLTSHSFWPWREEAIVEPFNSCPPGDYYLEAWDVYKDGVFQKTQYDIAVK